MLRTVLASALLALALPGGVSAEPQPQPTYGPELEGFAYPFPVERFLFTSQRQPLQMAYLDVRPAREAPVARITVAASASQASAARAGADPRLNTPTRTVRAERRSMGKSAAGQVGTQQIARVAPAA